MDATTRRRQPAGGTPTAPVSPDRILELGLGFWASKALLSAVELGLFTELARQPATAEALRQWLGLHERSYRDFLDALVALGMLDRDDGVYRNTAATDCFLDRAKPSYIGGMLEMANARLYPSWGSLTEGLRTGRPQNEAKVGGDVFAVLYQDPVSLKEFARAMTGLSMGSAVAIAERFPWKRYQSFVDIGTAAGNLPVQVALRHAHLTGGGTDLPQLKPIFEEYVASFGLQGRLCFSENDFLRDPLPRADVLVLGHILHDWDLDTKRLLIAKAFAALPAGGALIIYDTIIDDERRRNVFGLLMSLNMLIETPGGSDYTGADCCAWLGAAGFREIYVEQLVGPESMVVGVK